MGLPKHTTRKWETEVSNDGPFRSYEEHLLETWIFHLTLLAFYMYLAVYNASRKLQKCCVQLQVRFRILQLENFNWKNSRKHSATPRVLTRHFSGWNDVIHVSTTAVRHLSNFLYVIYNSTPEERVEAKTFVCEIKRYSFETNEWLFYIDLLFVTPFSL